MLRWAHLAIFISASALLAAVVVEATKEQEFELYQPEQQLLDPQPISGKAPSFVLKDMVGKTHSLDEFRGKWVLLVFWATWCEPCREELPHLATLAMKFSDLPFFLLMVSVDRSFEDINDMAVRLRDKADEMEFPAAWKAAGLFVTKIGPNFMTLLDPGSVTAKRYGTSMFPESYLIDPRGRLRKKFVGPKPWGMKKALSELRGILGQ